MINSELTLALAPLTADNTLRVTLSDKKNELCTYKRVTLRKSGSFFNIERLTEKQAFHEKIESGMLSDFLYKELTENFKQLSASCLEYDYSIKISKKGKILTNRTKKQSTVTEVINHNRKKNYIFEEGIFVPALYELGIMTSEGKIVASKYDKFKQINRFAECVDDAFKNNTNVDETLEIIDFGCGKSYLTFVLYYYFTEIKKINVSVTGLDLKQDVIKKCNDIAEKYGYKNLKFLCGDIKDYNPQKPPHMVITLHACDVATDYALYNAINWGSKYIFSVPCCQHELNSDISSKSLELMTGYGLIKERFCALATDAIRAKLLEYCGYKTDVLEFIDVDNSPKNILIRAEKKQKTNEFKKRATEREIREFSLMIGHDLTLKKLILY